MTCGIYEIRHVASGRRYVGQSRVIEERWAFHKWRFGTNGHENPKLQRAWNKYGKDEFVFVVLEECDEDQLMDREQFYLDQGYYYNLKFPPGSPRGYGLRGPRSPETKARISAACKAAWARDHDRLAAALRNQGKRKHPMSNETRRKISESRKGYRHTEESKSKMRATWARKRKEKS